MYIQSQSCLAKHITLNNCKMWKKSEIIHAFDAYGFTFLTLSQMTIFLLFKTERVFADNNFKSDKNGRKFFKQVESIVGKGEIACYEQFLLFWLCF